LSKTYGHLNVRKLIPMVGARTFHAYITDRVRSGTVRIPTYVKYINNSERLVCGELSTS